MTRRRIAIGLALAVLLLGAGWLFLHEPPLVLPRLDRIVVHKAERRMELYAGGRLVKTLTGLQLGDMPVGQKHFEGDEKTPEGRYTIDFRNPKSDYHLSMRISYPDAAANAFASAQGKSPGGEIYIHGQPNAMKAGRMAGDWTDGCIALSNRQIEALWRAVPLGTVVEVYP
jgi:murein L,D-transpeptidase YafK